MKDYYPKKLYYTNRKDIEDFIVDVRMDNIIYSTFRQMRSVVTNGSARYLSELNEGELYYELRGEAANIIYKGAYDSIKLCHKLNEEQSGELARRIASEDKTVFIDYKC